MKNLIRISLILVITMAFIKSYGQSKPKKPVKEVYLPEFTFQGTDNKDFNKKSLLPGKATFVFFFDPDCDHCNMQADWIKDEISRLKNVQMMWVSTAQMKDIADFEKKHFGNCDKKVIHFMKDPKYKFDSWFGYSEVPSIYVFNENGKKVDEYHNETAVEMLLRNLKK